MRYAHINANNRLLGWYADEVHSTIPTPKVVVTDEQWQTALDNNHNSINADGSGSVVDFSNDEEKALSVRESRNNILVTVVDPIAGNALRWAALTSEQQTAWATYRTALLDVPAQAGFPSSITWPTAP